MGLADVLVLVTWGVLALGSGFAIFSTAGPGQGLPLNGLAILGAAGACILIRSRWAAGALAVVMLVTQFTPGGTSTQTVAVFWGSLALAVLPAHELAIGTRMLATCIYGYAAVNKLLFSPFLSGGILAYNVPWLPAPQVFAVAAILCEAGLAWLCWYRPRFAVPAIIAFHVPLAFCIGQDPGHVLVLLVYGAQMAWMASGAKEVTLKLRDRGLEGPVRPVLVVDEQLDVVASRQRQDRRGAELRVLDRDL